MRVPGFFELFTELRALEAQKGRTDFIPELAWVLFGNRHRFGFEQAGVGHLDGGDSPVLVGNLLLGTKNIERFRKTDCESVLDLPCSASFWMYSGTIRAGGMMVTRSCP